MKKKKAIVELLLFFALTFLFAGCTEDSDISQTEKAETPGEASVQETEEISPERREIPIDFPFYGEEEEYKLVLAAPEEGQNAYELIYYDKDGKILQQIFCGNLTEPVTFSFDGLAYGSWEDLEIFSADSDTGLLYIWKDGQFSETPIGIPRYEECRGTAMLTATEDAELCEGEIYLLNEIKNRTDKARTFRLRKETEETALLFIWDELYHKTLFEGSVRLDENGNPLNEEYFDKLLWSNLPLLWDYKGEDTINTWVEKVPEQREEGEELIIDGFEDVYKFLSGCSGNWQQYESRQALLSDFGLENSEPMYRYFGESGNLDLELYADEDREQLCAIYYGSRFNYNLDLVMTMEGFILRSPREVKWNGVDPYMFRSVYGTTGAERENVKDYEENIEYTDFGKPDCFVSRGRVEGWSAEDEMQDIVRIDFTYREDGTLFYRDYYHSHQAFGTTLQSLHSYYDEQERVIFERGYITHGRLEYYYIYEDTGGKTADKPTYILRLDYDMEYVTPDIIKCL